MTKQKKYWKGFAELANDPIIDKLRQNEFVEEIPIDDFLANHNNLSSGKNAKYIWYESSYSAQRRLCDFR